MDALTSYAFSVLTELTPNIVALRYCMRPQNSEKPPLASSCPSVCPATWNKRFGYHWTDFYVFWYLSISGKSAKKIQDSLKSQKNNGYFT
jgi:hypothetical protein